MRSHEPAFGGLGAAAGSANAATVLTMTLTGIAADLKAGNVPVLAKRLLAVATMLAGAVLGAWLVLQVSPAAALGVAAGLLAAVTAGAAAAVRLPGPWRQSPT